MTTIQFGFWLIIGVIGLVTIPSSAPLWFVLVLGGLKGVWIGWTGIMLSRRCPNCK